MARPAETLVRLRTADCDCSPTSTNSTLLRTVVASDQNAFSCWRAVALVMRTDRRLMSSPHVTTARTPDAWIESASRNAANGTTRMVMFSSIGSSMRRRTCQFTRATNAPAAAPPP